MASGSLRAIERELARRVLRPRLLASLFAQQHAALTDPCRRKAYFVARRSGKTWGICADLIDTCLAEPAVKCLYYGLTADSAWDTVYLHMLEPICSAYGIPVRVNLSKRIVAFENRSYIKVTGDDADERQIDKALGGKYKKVVFDECQSITRDLRHWIEAKLGPAMVDQDGTIVLAGTAGDFVGDHFFWYRVTRTDGQREPGWSVHSWTPFDNPHVAPKVLAELEELKRRDPLVEQQPWYQQQWLCRWVVETESRIYHYVSARNGIEAIDTRGPAWRHVLALDFGYEDDTALLCGAFHQHDPCAYILESFKKPKMLLDEAGRLISDWRDRYSPMLIVADAQNKQLVETLRERYRLPITAAQKLGKVEHIAAMNSDFRTGLLKVVERGNESLVREWAELTWDERRRMLGEFRESPSKDNHLADAALYMHHALKHFRVTPAPVEDLHPWRTQAENELRERMATGGPTLYDMMERP